MIRTNSNFDTANANNSSPVVVVSINGLTNSYCNATFSGITSTYKKYLKDVKIVGGKINFAEFKTESFGIDFYLVDVDNTFQNEIVSNIIQGVEVTIKIGYQDLAISDFLELPKCYIKEWEVQDDQITFFVRARDKKSIQFKRDLFRNIPSTILDGDITDSDTTVTVLDTSLFTTARTALWGQTFGVGNRETYIRIGQEIMMYTATTSTSFTVTRAQLGTTAVAHYDGEEVSEVYRIYDTLTNYFKQLMTSDRDGTSLPDTFGLDFSTDEIDDLQIDTERQCFDTDQATFGSATTFNWIVEDTQNAEEYIANELLALMPGYIFYTENGKIGIRYWSHYINSEGLAFADWEDVDTENKPVNSDENMVTHVVLKDGYDPGTKRWTDIGEQYLSDIENAYGRKVTITVAPRLYNFTATAYWTKMLKRYFRNSLKGNMLLSNKVFHKKWIHQIGDVLSLTNDKLLYFGTGGGRGWTYETLMLIGSNIFIGSEESYCDNTYINHDAYAEVSNGVTTQVYNETDMDDETLTYSSDTSSTTESEDAYVDLSSGITADEVHVVLEGELPASADSEEYIDVKVWALKTSLPTREDGNYHRLYYNSEWSGTIRWYIASYVDNSHSWERVKVDYAFRSTTVANRLSSLKLTMVKMIQDNYSISERT
jgi:hypothetical protein